MEIVWCVLYEVLFRDLIFISPIIQGTVSLAIIFVGELESLNKSREFTSKYSKSQDSTHITVYSTGTSTVPGTVPKVGIQYLKGPREI